MILLSLIERTDKRGELWSSLLLDSFESSKPISIIATTRVKDKSVLLFWLGQDFSFHVKSSLLADSWATKHLNLLEFNCQIEFELGKYLPCSKDYYEWFWRNFSFLIMINENVKISRIMWRKVSMHINTQSFLKWY